MTHLPPDSCCLAHMAEAFDACMKERMSKPKQGWKHILGADFKDVPGKANGEKEGKLRQFLWQSG